MDQTGGQSCTAPQPHIGKVDQHVLESLEETTVTQAWGEHAKFRQTRWSYVLWILHRLAAGVLFSSTIKSCGSAWSVWWEESQLLNVDKPYIWSMWLCRTLVYLTNNEFTFFEVKTNSNVCIFSCLFASFSRIICPPLLFYFPLQQCM